MVRAQRKKEVLSPSAIEDLKQEKEQLENTIKEIEQDKTGEGTRAVVDVDRLKREVRFLEQRIKEGAPPKVAGVAKDNLAEEAKKLAEQIKVGMPTYKEMQNPAKFPGAIQKNMAWERTKQPLVLRWKQIMRTLEPGDPTAANVETLRSSG